MEKINRLLIILKEYRIVNKSNFSMILNANIFIRYDI